ncbi:hypothetical protein E3J95_00770 [Candidatus Aerophobetes bacterium]|uniref:Uncharacterized protein n=1 Tax=Aerophobetes bacterium TaxID=2030807 RepID=A0A523QM87_UNCAE|nr:MAG: hypothetical protein E3J95_00770 [Candidatus Aerophobetes bacterium]
MDETSKLLIFGDHHGLGGLASILQVVIPKIARDGSVEPSTPVVIRQIIVYNVGLFSLSHL